MAMPERICLAPDQERVLPARITWGTPYIRADLAVLATTHQRTLEALREAEKALERLEAANQQLAATRSSETYCMMLTDDGAEAALEALDTARRRARAALARIKEATDAG
jgi:hypothetical protein